MKSMDTISTRTRANVDLKALAHNIGALKRRCRDRVKVMAVVKANAYGHGDVEVA